MSAGRRLRAVLALPLLLAGLGAGAAPEGAGRAEPSEAAALPAASEALEARLREARAALRRLLRNESSVGAEVERWEQRLREAEAAMREARREAEEAERTLEELRALEGEARSSLSRRNEDLRARLALRYRLLRRGAGPSWMKASSQAEARRHTRALDRVLGGEVEAIEQTEEAVASLGRIQARLRQAEREALDRAAAAAARLEELQASREARALLLASLQEERRLGQQVVNELLQAQRRLAREMERLARQSSAETTGFAAWEGRLPWPVEGAVVELPFGRVVDAKFRTVTFQRGLDLRAPAGSPVRAVAAGTVAYAGWFRGYGNLVVVDHGDGFHSLYAHLDELDRVPKEPVEAGARLGTLGETGSLKGPYLYFELRQAGKPFDPLPWLQP